MFKDLQEIESKPSTYSLTRSSVALRQLLLEPNGVLQQANRSRKVKLLFPVRTLAKEPDELELVVHGFGSEESTGKLDQFLAQPCLWLLGYRYTARDIVTICANKEGGAHFDHVRDAKEQSLVNLTWAQKGIRINDGAYETPLLFVLAQIISATLNALGPLNDDILKPTAPRRPKTVISTTKNSRLGWLRRLFERLFTMEAAAPPKTQAVDERPLLKGQTFHREEIKLGGIRYEDCKFEECRITYDGSMPFWLERCSFEKCTFEMFGPALNTMRLFQSWYQSGEGGKRLMIATMAELRPDGSSRANPRPSDLPRH